MKATLELIQKRPEVLDTFFFTGVRAHDYWAYLFELAADSNIEIAMAQAAIFGSQQVCNATASQGPVKCSSSQQVTEINAFVNEADNRKKIEQRFNGFSKDRIFYKHCTDDSFPANLIQFVNSISLLHRKVWQPSRF